MNLLPCSKWVAAVSLCAVVVGCASSVDTSAPTVVRTPPPRNYEKTITNYLAFRIRNPPKNAEVNIGPPEPGACALDGYATSSRGWVVPVAYVTRTGEVTGKDTIRINAKPYYFWFLGNTIAGITPRIELCPGVGSGFEGPPPIPTAGGSMTTALAVSANAQAPRRVEADGADASQRDRAQDRAKAAGSLKPKSASSAKKAGASSGKARPPGKKKTHSRSKSTSR